MSVQNHANEQDRLRSAEKEPSSAILALIDGAAREIDGFLVRRVLPSAKWRRVGPFVFFDHMGPAELPSGQGFDVRPHPHINLATVTYLYEGQIVHRDSLGSNQAIEPGAINWMTAGRGIVHSERTAPGSRSMGTKLHGIQLWLALPQEHEETEPEFHHHPASSIPGLTLHEVHLRILAGAAYGLTSPVKTFSPLFYVEALMPKDGTLVLPEGYEDRAIYVAEGQITFAGEVAATGQMVIVAPGSSLAIHANTQARLMLLGGQPLDGTRHLWWNFVSSRKERIEQAKDDWTAGRFPVVPGDEGEFIPLPDR